MLSFREEVNGSPFLLRVSELQSSKLISKESEDGMVLEDELSSEIVGGCDKLRDSLLFRLSLGDIGTFSLGRDGLYLESIGLVKFSLGDLEGSLGLEVFIFDWCVFVRLYGGLHEFFPTSSSKLISNE